MEKNQGLLNRKGMGGLGKVNIKETGKKDSGKGKKKSMFLMNSGKD